ncbi:hypothetical protein [Cellulophaga sp. BC115SP]|uniref:hypothetical protein n=1 Tax=Cellulophaga sp. BC115SP TaxID=2683263 RepID=UPI001412B27A|nr:hypothetical protein [Cellulophaga sp. BC115SP]NBB29674.1 hypothetical protein [Cellulophaga sp. BC115SP]
MKPILSLFVIFSVAFLASCVTPTRTVFVDRRPRRTVVVQQPREVIVVEKPGRGRGRGKGRAHWH